jgi:cation/acetate symporter
MVSTTWVQFIKGTLLVVVCSILVWMLLARGFTAPAIPIAPTEVQRLRVTESGSEINGAPLSAENQLDSRLRREHGTGFGSISQLPGGVRATGPLGPVEYIEVFSNSTVTTWRKSADPGTGDTLFTPVERSGSELLLPGGSAVFKGVRADSLASKLDFLSLMLALFLGTASLPHILIRYYTVRDAAAARKSTVVGIGAIGMFYLLTLYLGLGAMTSGALDPTDSNMSAPLLARTFGEGLFAVVSAVAFTTVLGTVSGLVIAGAGAVVHDLMRDGLRIELDDAAQVRTGRIAAVVLGVGAIALGVLFEGVNVSFLVGWAFNVAASANLPALVMLLFWRGTTWQGVVASMSVGLLSSLGWILASPDTLEKLFGLSAARALDATLVPFSQPAIVTVPLGFAVLVVVSILTRREDSERVARA